MGLRRLSGRKSDILLKKTTRDKILSPSLIDSFIKDPLSLFLRGSCLYFAGSKAKWSEPCLSQQRKEHLSPFYFYSPAIFSVNGGTTCFFRETTPSSSISWSSKFWLNASATESKCDPTTKPREEDSKILVTINR